MSDHFGKQLPVLRRVRRVLFQRRAYLYRLLYTIWCEVCSLNARISIRLTMIRGDGVGGLRMCPEKELGNGSQETLFALTNARTDDIQALLENLPWVSLSDCHLFLLGWSAGYKWS